MFLSVIIPTYNRPQNLEIAVKSIASQVKRADIQIIVIGKTEENGNAEVCKRLTDNFSFVQVVNNPHTDYSQNFQAMFRAAADSEWAWTFGDDDILHAGALDFMIKRLEENPHVSFFHIAEESRASGRNVAATGTLFDLCCDMGWIEMTGFITGNVARGAKLAAAAETPRWHDYAKCSFVQSCAILEAFKDDQATFLDIPLIKTQSKDMTADALATWSSQNIAARYLFISQAVEKMVEDGILPVEMPAKFFRYLSYHLWDRFISHFVGDYLDREQVWFDDAWANVLRFTNFVREQEVVKQVHQDVAAVRGLITLHSYMSRNLEGIRNEIGMIGGRHEEPCYPYSFVQRNSVSEAETPPVVG